MHRRLVHTPAGRCFAETLEPRRLLAVDINIDAAQRFQQIDGFGTSIAWWKPNVVEQESWRNAYFQDLGSSMLRVDLNIVALPGSDGDLATPVTMVEDLQTNINAFDWNSVPTQRFGGVIQSAAAKTLDDFKLIGTIWTPPHWMKSGEMTSTGQPKVDPTSGQPLPLLTGAGAYRNSVGGVLNDSATNLEQFGRYIAAYVKGYEQKFGEPMYAVSLQNEPSFDHVTTDGGFNSCVYSPAQYAKALKAVASAFDHYGIATKIMGPEALSVGKYTYTSYINAIKSDPEAAKAIDLYALHGGTSADWWNQIKDQGRKGWMTETSGESATWDGALSMARNAQNALVQGNVSAWVYWQMSDGNAAPSAYTLTAGSDPNAAKYGAAKHFFRTIRPGAVRVAASPVDANGVYASAFVHDQNKTLTSVVINSGATAQTVNVRIGGTSISDFDLVRLSTADGVWKDAGPITFKGGVATFTLPARSMVTFQGDTGAGTVPVAGQTPYHGSPANIAAGATTTTTIQAEDFDKGGEGVAFHDVETANRGGKYRAGAGERVDIESTTDAGGGHNVGWMKSGEWLEYTINVAQAGTRLLEFRVASTGSNGKFHAEIDGVNKTGSLTMPNTGGWQKWTTISKTIDLPAGKHVLRLAMEAAGTNGSVGNFNWIRFAPTTAAPSGAQTPYKGTPLALTATGANLIQAEDFDNGGIDVAFSDTTSGNLGGDGGGSYRDTAVDIQPTADSAGGGHNVGWMKSGEWLEYTIDVKSPGLKRLEFRAASAAANGAFHAEIDGVNVTGTLNVPSTGGWQNWTTVSKSGVNLTSGVHVLKLKMDANGANGYVGNFNWFRIA